VEKELPPQVNTHLRGENFFKCDGNSEKGKGGGVSPTNRGGGPFPMGGQKRLVVEENRPQGKLRGGKKGGKKKKGVFQEFFEVGDFGEKKGLKIS